MRLVAATLLIGCGGRQDVDTVVPPTSGATTTPTGCVAEPVEPQVITVTTRDGVALEADRYPGSTGGPGFVLLHMIPPSNTRADWPRAFIDRLTCHGASVVAIDRRGAGGSAGTPVDSYEGPGGAWDVEAAVGALQELGVAPGVRLIGASNGSTSALDYAVLAQAEALPPVAAIAFLTGGSYTENQNPMSALPAGIPVAFAYGTAEASWSEAQQALDPDIWSFLAYEGGGHGTRLFGTTPRVKGDLEAFFFPD